MSGEIAGTDRKMRPPPRRLPDPPDAARGGVAARFAALLAQQETLCSGLEALADSLPQRLDTHVAVTLCSRLRLTLRRSHRLEEAIVFPALLAHRRDLGPLIERLRAEHLEDEDQSGDLQAALAEFVARPTKPEAETIGYMLRGLFVALRRHVACDRDCVLPLFRAARAR